MDLLDLTVTLSRGPYALALTDPLLVQAGVLGFDDAETSVGMDASPAFYGGFATGAQIPARRIMIPLLIAADGGSAWQVQRDLLRKVRRPTAGTTRITVRQGDATERVIDAWPEVQQAGWTAEEWGAWGHQRLGLDFVAERPWWRSLGALSAQWGIEAGEAFLSDSAPTHGADELARLADSNLIGGAVSLDVPGDEDTWPTWTVSGTKGPLTLTDDGTGRSFTVDLTGVTGVVTIATDPLAASATKDGGATNLWSLIAPPFDLWPLPPGMQSVSVTMTGADATSVVALSADGQWQSAA